MTTTMKVRSRWRWIGQVLIAATLLVTAACSAGDTTAGSDASAGTPAAGGTLTIYGVTSGMSQINPPNQRDFSRLVVDSLVYQDPQTLEFRPWLATSWEVNADGSEFTFHLRDGVTFSDGTRLDAAVVRQNFDFFAQQVVPGGHGPYARGVFDSYLGTDVVDDRTLVVRFSRGNVPFLTRVATATLGIQGASTFTHTLDEQAQGQFVGSGPFVLQSFRPGVGLTYTARPDYNWGPGNGDNHTGRAYLDTVEVRLVGEENVREGAVQSGEADIATQISPIGVSTFTGNPDIRLTWRPQPGIQYGMQWNFDSPDGGDPAVRRAVQMAVDRQALSAVTGPHQPAGTSPLAPTVAGYQDVSAMLVHDPAQATRLLDEAGWVPGADGIRERNGTRLELSVVAFDEEPSRTVLQLMQEQLQQVGVGVELHFENDWTAAWRAGEYDAAATYQTDPDPDLLRTLFWDQSQYAGRVGNPDNSGGLGELLAAQVSEPDQARRSQMVADAQRLVIENADYTVLTQVANVFASTSRVRGADSFTTFSNLDLYNIWVSE